MNCWGLEEGSWQKMVVLRDGKCRRCQLVSFQKVQGREERNLIQKGGKLFLIILFCLLQQLFILCCREFNFNYNYWEVGFFNLLMLELRWSQFFKLVRSCYIERRQFVGFSFNRWFFVVFRLYLLVFFQVIGWFVVGGKV